MSFGSKSLEKPTADEQARMDLMKIRGCLISGYQGEIHHLLVGGMRAGHRYTICLNSYLHRGVPFGLFTLEHCKKLWGPSLAAGSKAFHRRNGTDQELLNRQDGLIGWPRAIIQRQRNPRKSQTQPSAKNYPRKV